MKEYKAIENDLANTFNEVLMLIARGRGNGGSVVELAKEMREIQGVQDSMDAIWKELTKRYDELRLRAIPDAMAEDDMKSITIEGIGRVGLTNDAYVSIIDAGDGVGKQAAHKWLVENGYSGLVQEYVQPATLKATVKEGLKQGEWFPDLLFKITPFTRASITKVKG